jgi:hypothetical protein
MTSIIFLSDLYQIHPTRVACFITIPASFISLFSGFFLYYNLQLDFIQNCIKKSQRPFQNWTLAP